MNVRVLIYSAISPYNAPVVDMSMSWGERQSLVDSKQGLNRQEMLPKSERGDGECRGKSGGNSIIQSSRSITREVVNS